MSAVEAARLAQEGEQAFIAGDRDNAQELFRKALQRDPNCYPALRYMGGLMSALGRIPEAMQYCERALRMQPNDLEGTAFLASCNFQMMRYQEAADYYRRAVAMNPGVATYHENLGVALTQLSKDAEAEPEFNAAIALAPERSILAYAGVAHIRVVQQDFAAAAALYRKAHAVAPESGFGKCCLGAALVYEEDREAAIAVLEESIEIQPLDLAFTLLAKCLQGLGRFQEAENVLKRSIDLGVNRSTAYMGIAMGRRMTEQDRPFADQMRATLQGAELTLSDACSLHFALGKTLHDIGEYELAIKEYDAANEASAKLMLGDRPFNPDSLKAEYQFVASTFTKDFFAKNRSLGNESRLPIFILGMMRSGTTLTEQIVSRHPDVGAAGELPFWLTNLTIVDLATRQIDEPRLKEVQSQYIDLLQRLAPTKRHVTNKAPGNYGAIGLIHLAFPNAKIIHCKRDPVDTVLSNYMTPNSTPVSFGYVRENLVQGYKAYRRLTKLYKSVLPPESILDVQYEELVADQETVIRRIIAFLGLEWNDACLKHEESEGSVRTPSMWQVRQPIYTGAVKRWKKYEPWLGAFAELIEPE